MLKGYYEIESKDTDMRPVWGWNRPHHPNTEQRHKTYSIEQLRIARDLRDEAGQEGKLLPPLPCPYKICAACDSYREYWTPKLQANKSLF